MCDRSVIFQCCPSQRTRWRELLGRPLPWRTQMCTYLYQWEAYSSCCCVFLRWLYNIDSENRKREWKMFACVDLIDISLVTGHRNSVTDHRGSRSLRLRSRCYWWIIQYLKSVFRAHIIIHPPDECDPIGDCGSSDKIRWMNVFNVWNEYRYISISVMGEGRWN